MITEQEVREKTPERFWKKVKFGKPDQCWEWQAYRNTGGYGVIKVSFGTTIAHRKLYQLLFGVLPKDIFACHKCDNRACCNPNHLFAGTRKDNMGDMAKKGRSKGAAPLGSKNGSAKLYESHVNEIRRRLLKGEPQSVIARDFRVSQPSISQIASGKTWCHVNWVITGKGEKYMK